MASLDDGMITFVKVPGRDESEIALEVRHNTPALHAIQWEQIWGEQCERPYGNRLLSLESRKLKPTELLSEALYQSSSSCVTLADYSQLGPAAGKICSISKTALRGITVLQLDRLLSFVKEMAPYWYEIFGPAAGQALRFESFNLYNANYWIIMPATEGFGGGGEVWVSQVRFEKTNFNLVIHPKRNSAIQPRPSLTSFFFETVDFLLNLVLNRTQVMRRVNKGCSYVELVATEASAQRPRWFVSHAWKEPILHFAACLRKHLLVRGLTMESPYWVCAYANNQHMVDQEIPEDPRETAFFRAMQICDGVLLVLDQHHGRYSPSVDSSWAGMSTCLGSQT